MKYKLHGNMEFEADSVDDALLQVATYLIRQMELPLQIVVEAGEEELIDVADALTDPDNPELHFEGGLSLLGEVPEVVH